MYGKRRLVNMAPATSKSKGWDSPFFKLCLFDESDIRYHMGSFVSQLNFIRLNKNFEFRDFSKRIDCVGVVRGITTSNLHAKIRPNVTIQPYVGP
jgi:hypothetical protein